MIIRETSLKIYDARGLLLLLAVLTVSVMVFIDIDLEPADLSRQYLVIVRSSVIYEPVSSACGTFFLPWVILSICVYLFFLNAK